MGHLQPNLMQMIREHREETLSQVDQLIQKRDQVLIQQLASFSQNDPSHSIAEALSQARTIAAEEGPFPDLPPRSNRANPFA